MPGLPSGLDYFFSFLWLAFGLLIIVLLPFAVVAFLGFITLLVSRLILRSRTGRDLPLRYYPYFVWFSSVSALALLHIAGNWARMFEYEGEVSTVIWVTLIQLVLPSISIALGMKSMLGFRDRLTQSESDPGDMDASVNPGCSPYVYAVLWLAAILITNVIFDTIYATTMVDIQGIAPSWMTLFG